MLHKRGEELQELGQIYITGRPLNEGPHSTFLHKGTELDTHQRAQEEALGPG